MPTLSLAFKELPLQDFPVPEGTIVIGNQQECQIHIDSLALLPQHARIETSGENSMLINLASKEGTFVNQQRVEQHALQDGDQIQVGKHTLVYHADDIAPAANVSAHNLSATIELQQPLPEPLSDPLPQSEQAPKQGWLQILNGRNVGKTLGLQRSRTKLGKHDIATAIITKSDDGYSISHAEGKYPPLIDDIPIGESSYHLSDGEIIQIGNIRLQFYLK